MIVQPDIELPWQSISTVSSPELGDEIYVWNGEEMLFANWRYGWPSDEVKFDDEPCWCDGWLRLCPQPTHWLPLSPPKI